jgi:citrate lyase beta subunit
VKVESLLGELARALIVTEEAAPESWGETVLHIGHELFDRAPDTEQMDRWRTYLAAATRRYGLLVD